MTVHGGIEEIRQLFNRSKHGREVARELFQCRLGCRSVSDFSIDFQNLATSSGWKEQALYDAFLHGLVEEVKDELLTCDLWGDMVQEVRAVVWQSEGCRFDPTLGVSKCP